jgi:phage tail-like protein
MSGERTYFPGFLFRFDVAVGGKIVCGGLFSEVSGIEATMEPKSIREGGRNWGEVHRVGHTDFATVILKRGMTQSRDLWSWFAFVNREKMAYGFRADARVVMLDLATTAAGAAPAPDANTAAAPAAPHREVLAWRLSRALPVKFKIGDLNAATTHLAIEELHVVHEGIELEQGSAPA